MCSKNNIVSLSLPFLFLFSLSFFFALEKINYIQYIDFITTENICEKSLNWDELILHSLYLFIVLVKIYIVKKVTNIDIQLHR